MRLGMIGLGRMGSNMTRRLLDGGHEVVAHDIDAAAVEEARGAGAVGAASIDDLVELLDPPRVVWMMLPAGDVTASAMAALAGALGEGDVVVDGGNSRYTDSQARASDLAARGIALADAGTSGGIWGLSEGYCLMVGADDATYARLEPILATLAPPDGYAHVGPPGAGHFVKMVHNGVEYALMQSYAEGFELLADGPFEIDTVKVAELWRHGSVVRSWLLDLTAQALSRDPRLEDVAAFVEDSGEGRWTVETAIDHAVPVPAIASALFARFASRRESSFGARLLAALRREFGGHDVRSPQDHK